MTKSMFRLGYTLLISGIMVAAAEPSSSAGTKIQVTFSGTNASGINFSGCFQYDESQAPQSSYVFNFRGSPLSHEICYQIGSAPAVSASGRPCEPFTIGTNGTTFQLQGTLRGSTTVLIALPSSVTFLAGSLPFCNVSTTPAFQNTGTFTVTNATTRELIFTGNITATNCTQSTGDINCSCFSPSFAPAPQAAAPYAPSKIVPAPQAAAPYAPSKIAPAPQAAAPYAPSVVSMCAPRPPQPTQSMPSG